MRGLQTTFALCQGVRLLFLVGVLVCISKTDAGIKSLGDVACFCSSQVLQVGICIQVGTGCKCSKGC